MASGLLAAGCDGGYSLGLEETELRLGLPGGDGEPARNPGKRGFLETLDLKLKLPTVDVDGGGDGVETVAEKAKKALNQKNVLAAPAADPEKPPATKAQVVGWPPVRSFRKNIFSVQSSKGGDSKEDGEKSGGPATASFVKVSMDGVPYLRKVDLKMYRSYQELSMSLEKMFSSITSAECLWAPASV